MAQYLADHGVPREAILVDSAGNNTYLTAQHTAELAKANGFQSSVLISYFYHLPRARLAFQLFKLVPVTPAHAERFVPRDFYFGLFREVIAYPIYCLRPYGE